MGARISHAAAPPPPPVPTVSPLQRPIHPLGVPPDGQKKKEEEEDKDTIDWFNLPCPVKYEDLRREAMMSLKPELFEGLRFDLTKPLNQKFALSHSVLMGPCEVPAQPGQTFKVPVANYEFGANLATLNERLLLFGRILTDGRMSARMFFDASKNLMIRGNAQLTNEPHLSQGMLYLDYKGKDYQAQLQLGNNAYYCVNYMQSVSPRLALGAEAFWLGHQRRSGVGFAARYDTQKMIATAQFVNTGLLYLTYMHKVSDKVSLTSEFMYNSSTREATTTVGYDYIMRHCRLRGRIDNNACVGAYLEERLNMGVNFLLSAEVDHWKKDYKFGLGMTVGE